MKKIFIISAILAMFCAFDTAYAESGDIIGHVYSTDILAVIGGNEVPAYNIGGRTAVVIEDLSNEQFGYPFSFAYDNSSRLLTVSGTSPHKTDSHVSRGTVGEITGDVLETDIKVLFNGSYIQGYNIGGKTAVCIEDMGDLTDSPNEAYGYSKYAAKYEWNGEGRTISLDFAASAPPETPLISLVHQIHCTLDGNVLTVKYDDMNEFYSDITCTPMAEKYVIKPLYLVFDGKSDSAEEIGICYSTDVFTTEININFEWLAERINAYKAEHKKSYTYDEVLKMFGDDKNFTTLESVDIDGYTVLLVKDLKRAEAKEDNCIALAAVKENGEFIIMTYSTEYQDMHITKTKDTLTDDTLIEFTEFPVADPHGQAVTLRTVVCPADYFKD